MSLIPETIEKKHEYISTAALTHTEQFLNKIIYDPLASKIPKVYIYIYIYVCVVVCPEHNNMPRLSLSINLIKRSPILHNNIHPSKHSNNPPLPIFYIFLMFIILHINRHNRRESG